MVIRLLQCWRGKLASLRRTTAEEHILRTPQKIAASLLITALFAGLTVELCLFFSRKMGGVVAFRLYNCGWRLIRMRHGQQVVGQWQSRPAHRGWS